MSNLRVPEVDFAWRDIRPVGGDLHLGWKRALEGLPDVFWSPHYGGHWVLQRADDMSRVYQDLEHFSSSDITIPPMSANPAKAFKIVPAESDPPMQREYRRLLAPAFSAPQLQRLEAAAHALAADLIADLKPRRRCDFVPQFAQRYPVQVFLSMVELPAQDDAILLPYADAFVRGKTIEERGRGLHGMVGYIRQQLDLRKGRNGSDIFSQIGAGTVDGRPLTDEEALGACCNLLFAGLDTVVAASSFHMRFLAAHPGHVRQLREEPALIPQAVEELLRYHGLTNLGRRVIKDIEIGGVLIPQGDMVMMPLTVHGLDERKYTDPLTVDFRRKGPPNMIFGSGPHFCLGNRLARLELKVLLELWLEAIPEFSVEQGREITTASNGTNMMLTLPLVW